MEITILIPHYQEGKATAYAISQLLKYKGKHQVDIIIIDNGAGDKSIDYLYPFRGQIGYIAYPKGRLQSHGIGLDYALSLGIVHTEYFITMESDSFPTKDNWLDSYERLTNQGFDSGGSLLKLSGGQYVHPCGAFYKKSIWQEAKEYCDNIQYDYFPNMSHKDGFDHHLMIRKDKTMKVVVAPQDFMEVGNSYKGLTAGEIMDKATYYKATVSPFHNGMGKLRESIKTYGNRNTESGKIDALLDNELPMIERVGYEPGEWLCFYQLATERKIALIPTEIKWMKNRGSQQQEYTLMDNGLKHIWAGTSYLGMKDTAMHDVYEFKKNQIEQLYNSLPKEQKI